MKIVLSGLGTRGDLQPLMLLARALGEVGADAVVLGPPAFAALGAELGVPYVPVGSGVGPLEELATGRIPLLRAKSHVTSWLKHEVESTLAGLLEHGKDADLLVGAGIAPAVATASEILAKPYRFLAYSPLIVRSAHWQPLLSPQRIPRWMWGVAWSGIGMLGGLLATPLNDVRKAQGLLPITGGFFEHVFFSGKDPPWLSADPTLAALPADVAPKLDPLDAQLPPLSGPPLDASLEQFLQSGAPPVFIGFGSMGPHGVPLSSITNSLVREGFRLVIGGGPATTPQPHVLTIGATHHPSLFPRCSVVVHHGGAGTVHTALRAGIPQVICGFGGDQFYWGERLHSLGLAPPPLDARHVEVSQILSSVQEARKLSSQTKAFAEAHPHPGNARVAEKIIRWMGQRRM